MTYNAKYIDYDVYIYIYREIYIYINLIECYLVGITRRKQF